MAICVNMTLSTEMKRFFFIASTFAFGLIGVAFSIYALIAPFWSTLVYHLEDMKLQDGMLGSQDREINFGLLKFCYLPTSDTDQVCFSFHASYTCFFLEQEVQSLCDLLATEGTPRDRQISFLAGHIGTPTEEFDTFMTRTCGALGLSTLFFASLSTALGFVSLVGIMMGFTFCRRNTRHRPALIAAGKWLALCATVLTIVTCTLWIFQAYPISKLAQLNFGSSFNMSIMAAAFYAITFGMVPRHQEDILLKSMAMNTKTAENSIRPGGTSIVNSDGTITNLASFGASPSFDSSTSTFV